MEKLLEVHPEYQRKYEEMLQWDEADFTAGLRAVQATHNQSAGLHTWQMMAGCEVGLDRPRGRYLRFGYDGSTYLSLEVETLTWTAADAMAQKMKRSWEANPSITQRFRAYVEKTCAEWSQARLDHGEEGLGRREPPKVTVAGRAGQDDTETLICRDHGFYPREIDMAWTRDGEVWLQDASHGVLAPNSDGTFYAWLSVRLDPWDRECFLCRVEHDALQTPVELAWEEPESLPTYNLGRLIWPTIGVLAVLLGIVVAVLSLKALRGAYGPASEKIQGSYRATKQRLQEFYEEVRERLQEGYEEARGECRLPGRMPAPPPGWPPFGAASLSLCRDPSREFRRSQRCVLSPSLCLSANTGQASSVWGWRWWEGQEGVQATSLLNAALQERIVPLGLLCPCRNNGPPPSGRLLLMGKHREGPEGGK
ncbi:RLA class I histocompatibility antigen, alpha chain 11/11-like [Varanus komodoensis]|uniref:RLA class I histocompatibility antigen, alpha chain 11/11-like n=1 Tax=Varanus komodoensis TaxID=61221 RepID=UPI001CF7DCF3|nr:RLA class I histocompatibility antigen, alpha chain 11/11-like [Varanus komodoensis]